MCGIAGIHRTTKSAVPRVDYLASALLDGIESRGRDATGFVALADNGTPTMQKASCSAWDFNKHRRPIPADARTVLLHTRWSTQGDPCFPENNHPVTSGNVYVVHNGHINNDDATFRAIGTERIGQVDSEAIPAVIEHHGWDDALMGLATLEGQLAIAAIDTRRPGSLLLARGNDSPLVIVEGQGFIVWASTAKAIADAWAETFGTPPASTRFKTMKEGSALVWSPDGVEGKVWTPPRIVYSYKGWKDDYSSESWAQRKQSAFATPPRPALAAAAPISDAEMAEYLSDARAAAKDIEEIDDVLACDDCGDWYFPEDMDTIASASMWDDQLCRACAEHARANARTNR